jgi:uncharacterized RDD family membrane protein YckC
MENEFAKVMSERTDEELIKIVTVERENYNPTAIEAADLEVEKRNVDTTKFSKIKKSATKEKTQKQKVDSNVVGSGIRAVNFLIDSIVWSVIAIVLGIIIVFIADLLDLALKQLLITVVYIGTFLAYYAIMEVKFQKTVGKFVTKTKVVKMNGEKPTEGDITTRTFCRLIPFDRLSFLFTKNGIHDFLSKTKVVKDGIE